MILTQLAQASYLLTAPYGGYLAPHSHLRGAIIPTPRQQGVDEPEARTGSYALSGDDVKAFQAGCDGYVAKPFDPRTLLATIRTSLA